MSERLEYSGDPLPSGLPGFGGGTITVLPLPGFSRVVAAQKFGPVNDVPTSGGGVTPPSPEPPPGSDPENPTDEVVPPAPAPPSGPGASNNFCDKCTPPTATSPENALLKTYAAPSSCTDCQGGRPGTIDWFDTAATSANAGLFHGGGATLRGKELDGRNWELDANTANGLRIGNSGSDESCTLTRFKVTVGKTEYRKGPIIYDGEKAETYQPQELEVCEGGETKTWKVLAYKQP
jgi:hypothetical protein